MKKQLDIREEGRVGVGGGLCQIFQIPCYKIYSFRNIGKANNK